MRSESQTRLRFPRQRFVLTALGVALLAFAITPAGAYASDIDDVLDAYSFATEEQPGSMDQAVVPAGLVSTPADPSDGLRIGSGDGAIRIFPEEDAAEGSRISQPDGSVVYRGGDRDVATVVAPTADGAQIATVSSNQTDSESFAYKLDLPDGARVVPSDDGGAEIVAADGASLATVDTPWAQDAGGKDLQTSYTIRGETLVQTIDTRGAKLPVVADPRIETHWHWFGAARFWLTRRETERAYRRREAGGAAAAAAGLVCAVLPFPFDALCAVVVAAKYADFSINVRQAHQRHHCLTVYVRPVPAKIDFDDGDGRYCVHP